ncbi:MAG TPA: hypothetical protein VGY97_09715 [Solirubrobacteraceae bacterium]|nr:hypothetical protein [Solirubrobacteraceae bacterium]
MSLLRRMPRSHLLALCATVVAIGVAGTAIASALGGGTPPPPQRLANAVHQGLTAPRITGLSAHIHFTNNLIDASSLVGRDPLLTGADGRLWVDPAGHRLRIELTPSEGNDSQLMVDNGSFWFYDGASDTVYKGTLPQHSTTSSPEASGAQHQPPTVADIQTWISKLGQHVNVSGAEPGVVAGQGAYTVKVSPRTNGGLLGGIQLAWDAAHGVPLRFAVYAQGNSNPVLELKATDVQFSLPSDAFSAGPPPGAKVVNVQIPQGGQRSADSGKPDSGKTSGAPVTGLSAVQAAIPFKLSAPDSLNGLQRNEVRLLRFNGSPGALIFYGQGLNGIAVLERAHPAGSGKSATGVLGAATGTGSNYQNGGSSSDHGGGPSLPAVQIGNATGHELATALGTVITFQRDDAGTQVDYTVAGSVATHVAEAAARAL